MSDSMTKQSRDRVIEALNRSIPQSPNHRIVVGMLIAIFAATAVAQDFPTKPIRIIVPYPPGGPSDMQARLIGIELTKAWGQTSVIDNRGGGSGIIGTELAARADADGHTLILMSATN